jgi:hypothetical protein
MSDIEYDPELIATKDEIRAAVREIAMNTDAINFIEFSWEVEESIGSDLIIPPEMDWIVEEAIQDYSSLALDEENGNV